MKKVIDIIKQNNCRGSESEDIKSLAEVKQVAEDAQIGDTVVPDNP